MANGRFLPGDPVPWFRAASPSNPQYDFSSAAGRFIVLCFFGSAADPVARSALDLVIRNREIFDDSKLCFFGISIDPADAAEQRVRQMIPGIRLFWDFDRAICRRYGLFADNDALRRCWLVLDPMLRVVAQAGLSEGEAIIRYLRELPPVEAHAGVEMLAPVLVLPRVFERELCRHLIDLYEKHGGEESGFMREVDGRTVAVRDNAFKSRADYTIDDEALRQELRQRIITRLVPEVQKAFQFKVTRMERYIVARYDAETQGKFLPHRDNTTKGTAHRRFAVSINLNAEEYAGGDLRFPEFGSRTYRAPTGGAVVFSCSLLHEVTPMTAGRRYTFLPFMYDEEGARIREQNNRFLGDGVGVYRSGLGQDQQQPAAAADGQQSGDAAAAAGQQPGDAATAATAATAVAAGASADR